MYICIYIYMICPGPPPLMSGGSPIPEKCIEGGDLGTPCICALCILKRASLQAMPGMLNAVPAVDSAPGLLKAVPGMLKAAPGMLIVVPWLLQAWHVRGSLWLAVACCSWDVESWDVDRGASAIESLAWAVDGDVWDALRALFIKKLEFVLFFCQGLFRVTHTQRGASTCTLDMDRKTTQTDFSRLVGFGLRFGFGDFKLGTGPDACHSSSSKLVNLREHAGVGVFLLQIVAGRLGPRNSS